jgi:hypothetical protein
MSSKNSPEKESVDKLTLLQNKTVTKTNKNVINKNKQITLHIIVFFPFGRDAVSVRSGSA